LWDVVIVGAGPGGLSTAAVLRKAGIRDVVIVDRAGEVGASWQRHYDRLHLHTVRWLSHLPGHKIPASEGPWVSRDHVVRYLKSYARHHQLDVRLGVEVTRVERDDGRWLLRSPTSDLVARQVVIATGYNNTPHVPEWEGLATFTGEVIHTGEYKNGKPYAGKRVMVVGTGNTGAEIAVDLTECGAKEVLLSYRTPPHILRRSTSGIPTQATGVLMRYVPTGIADVLTEISRRQSVPDLTPYGLPDPGRGLTVRARNGEFPILDVGLVDAIVNGAVKPVPTVQRFDGPRVHLVDGRVTEPEVVVVATGYRRGLEPLVGHLGVLDGRGIPVVHGGRTHIAAPGLRFTGFTAPVSGAFREFGIDARRIAPAVVRDLRESARPRQQSPETQRVNPDRSHRSTAMGTRKFTNRLRRRSRDFSHDVVLVTGGGSGIGRATAHAFAERGATVLVVDLLADRARTVVKEIQAAGGTAEDFAADCSDAPAIEELASMVFEKHGRVDILHNNAGIGHGARIEETSAADWKRIIDVNLGGVANCVAAFVPRMLKQGRPGHIINTGSSAALVPQPRFAPYVATKSGVVGLTEAMDLELAPRGIRVSAICPGIVNTRIIQDSTLDGELEAKRELLVKFYAKYGVTPESVAKVVVRLAERPRVIATSPAWQLVPVWMLHRTNSSLTRPIVNKMVDMAIGYKG
jgi:putative flavoprotein involved in K+ transport